MSLKQLEDMVSAWLFHEKLPTPETIRAQINQIRCLPMFASVTDEDAEHLAKELETKLDVGMAMGSQLTAEGFRPWHPQRRAEIDPYFWGRYRKLLVGQGFPKGVLETLDQVTDNITGLLEDPLKEGEWDRRGMVVGHVQSGKTANYTGLICKAADAGYKLIIVIAGVHNNLRSQTQARIDEGFIGRDTGKGLALDGQDNRIGVGMFDTTRKPASFTNTMRDFNKQQASTVGVSIGDLKNSAILVIKKNSSTLSNLISWLKDNNAKRGGGKIADPVLLIDDEADNASINTAKNPNEATKINGQIRSLLDLFGRKCYVGYTATPFANIFIDPETDDQMLGADLFPRDFIVSLEPPDNYFGASKVFLDNSDAIIRPISDNEDRLPVGHKITHRVTSLPGSLENAVHAFVIVRAIRIARGQAKQHSSMLVNASRFTSVQAQIRNEIHGMIGDLREAIRTFAGLGPTASLKNDKIRRLYETWGEEFSDAADWESVHANLVHAVGPIQVIEVNAKSKGGLDYRGNAEHGLHVIAVGGFSLSRGLTLEGLAVSYFLRNSLMYDTLMQMGRWFGYRPGYEDLCRVWMPEDAQGWYEHIAEATDELRSEFKAMEAINATPAQFGLRVRSHPDTLIVTARNKMGTGKNIVVQIGLGRTFIETAVLRADEAAIMGNRDAARRLAAAMRANGHDPASGEKVSGGVLFRSIPVDLVTDFVRAYSNSEGAFLTAPEPVIRYIEERQQDELAFWDVMFTSLTPPVKMTDSDVLGMDIHCQYRMIGDRSNYKIIRVSNKQRVASRGIEKTGLTDDEIKQAQSAFIDADPSARKKHEAGEPVNYPDRIYREVRKKPLLIVHLLELRKNNQDPPVPLPAVPVVAWGISFPKTAKPEKKVQYVVGAVWLKENMPDDGDDEDSGGEDSGGDGE
jgi:hypothetical protein